MRQTVLVEGDMSSVSREGRELKVPSAGTPESNRLPSCCNGKSEDRQPTTRGVEGTDPKMWGRGWNSDGEETRAFERVREPCGILCVLALGLGPLIALRLWTGPSREAFS